MNTPLRVLMVEDSEDDALLVVETLRRGGYDVSFLRVQTEPALREALREDGWDLIFSDYCMPSFDAPAVIGIVQEADRDIPLIVISGTVGEEVAVEALKLGADDYLLKQNLTRLVPAVKQALLVAEEGRQKRALEHMKSLVMQNSLDMICTMDGQGCFLEVSAASQAIIGYSPVELTGRPFMDFVHPDDRERTLFGVASVFAGHPANDFENRYISKDGKTVHLMWSGAWSETDGVLVAVARDMTERRRNEEALRLRDKALAEVSQGVLMSDENRIITYANASFTTITGYAEAEAIGCHCFFLQGPDTDPATVDQIRTCLKAAQPFEGELLTYRKDGTPFWNDLSITPFQAESDQPRQYIAILRDITERKQAEGALRWRTAFFEAQVSCSPDGILVVDSEGKKVLQNQRLSELLRIPPEIVENPDDSVQLSFVTGRMKNPGQFAEKVAHLYANPDAVSQHEIEMIDGTIIDRFSSPVKDAAGNHYGRIWTFRDITERKRVEDALRWRTAFFEAQVASSLDGIIVVDSEGRKILQNQRMADLLKIPPEIAESLDDQAQVRFVASQVNDPAAFSEKVSLIFANPDSVSRDEFELLDGTVLDRYSSPVKDAAGHHYGRITTFRDITERKETQQALARALERLQLSIKAGRIGTWDLNIVTGETHWDEQTMALYGATPEMLTAGSDRWERFVHPDDLAEITAIYDKALRGGGETFETTSRIHRGDDGRERFMRGMGFILRDAAGRPVRMTGINWDITDERNRERQLTEALAHEKDLSEKARAGELAKSEFLAVMSHEVRTPLNGILGFSELLARTPNLPPESRDYAQTISSSGHALLRILDDVLDFSRLEAGRVEIETTSFDPRRVFEDIRALLAPLARDKGLRLLSSVDETTPPRLEGDVGRLRQILLNLVGNALKFTERGSVLFALRPLPDGKNYEFSVKDTGPGITPGQIDRIFQPFTQADSSISRRHGGSGMGLAISRSLAELMGGTLTVRSEPGEGSGFLVTVPLGSDVPASVAVAPAAYKFDQDFARQHPLDILVVEDDKVNLKLIATLLRRLGYDPLSAKNGREAVELLENLHPNCVLMDLQMPEMDGIEATQRIRTLEKAAGPAQPAFISALTANIFPADRQRCFDAGMNSYLNKPIQLASLAATLTEASEFVNKHS